MRRLGKPEFCRNDLFDRPRSLWLRLRLELRLLGALSDLDRLAGLDASRLCGVACLGVACLGAAGIGATCLGAIRRGTLPLTSGVAEDPVATLGSVIRGLTPLSF